MADRVMVWYVENIDRDGTEQGPAFYADQDYAPTALRVMARRVPDADALTVTIKDDGVAIMDRVGRLPKNKNTEEAAEEFPKEPATIKEGSLVTCDIVPSGAKGITVQLELEALGREPQLEASRS